VQTVALLAPAPLLTRLMPRLKHASGGAATDARLRLGRRQHHGCWLLATDYALLSDAPIQVMCAERLHGAIHTADALAWPAMLAP
jgi:hypothetical protein